MAERPALVPARLRLQVYTVVAAQVPPRLRVSTVEAARVPPQLLLQLSTVAHQLPALAPAQLPLRVSTEEAVSVQPQPLPQQSTAALQQAATVEAVLVPLQLLRQGSTAARPLTEPPAQVRLQLLRAPESTVERARVPQLTAVPAERSQHLYHHPHPPTAVDQATHQADLQSPLLLREAAAHHLRPSP